MNMSSATEVRQKNFCGAAFLFSGMGVGIRPGA